MYNTGSCKKNHHRQDLWNLLDISYKSNWQNIEAQLYCTVILIMKDSSLVLLISMYYHWVGTPYSMTKLHLVANPCFITEFHLFGTTPNTFLYRISCSWLSLPHYRILLFSSPYFNTEFHFVGIHYFITEFYLICTPYFITEFYLVGTFYTHFL